MALLSAFGGRGVTLTLLPGLAAALWLLGQLRLLPRGTSAGAGSGSERVRGSAPRDGRFGGPGHAAVALQLAVVVGVMMSQIRVLYAIQAFVPVWYNSLGYGPSCYGALLTTILLATALGTVLCGALADRYGSGSSSWARWC